MRPNPWQDIAAFLSTPNAATVVFWLLLLVSCAAAAWAWRVEPTQRTMRHVLIWQLRLLVGAMWWQQSLWKIPSNYNGLRFWMQQMVDHASIPLQGQLVQDFVLPNIAVFGPLVYGAEVLIGASLILGFLTRAGAILGVSMAINLWLGLYSAPNEWPWTYGFLVIIQFHYLIDPPGQSLGADVILRRRGRLPIALG